MTIEQFVKIVFVQSALSALIALVCFYRYRDRDLSIKLIGFTFLFGSVINLTPLMLVQFKVSGFNNLPPIIFIIYYFTLVTLLYREQFQSKRMYWIILIGVFILAVIINSIFFQKRDINSFSYIILSVTILIYTIAFFYKLMEELPTKHIHQLPMFWINSGLLFYHAGSFFLFAFTDYIVRVLKNDLMIYWTFHNILNILEHSIILLGIYYDVKHLPPRTNKHIVS
ncbi:hypothetical protein [Pseudochryseolinea flava]|uniref:YhhN-like protein n=1 Tax=Pseudochryseolinea flava TaxID=2059302 RepID=A0A364Y9T3_9BACT|nr:hypothetical protein [Pseudochryseolinea flava]RAW03119.1 hypothetical protein DQQ10_03210 [Pseudochryseolinea flava]